MTWCMLYLKGNGHFKQNALSKIKLVPFLADDFDRFISWIDSKSFMLQFAGPIFTYPVSHEQLKKYVSEKSRRVYKVLNDGNNQVIGHCELGQIDLVNEKVRICRVLVADQAKRGKGYGKSIINALLHIAFEELNLNRVDLSVFGFNKGAMKCYEQCGFIKETLPRESFKIEGEYKPVYNMSIARQEWCKS